MRGQHIVALGMQANPRFAGFRGHDGPRPARKAGRGRRRWLDRLIAAVLVLAGAVAMAWPVGVTRIQDRQATAVVTRYLTSVKALPPPVLSQEFRAAQDYNSTLPATALDDPWGGGQAADDLHARYLATLSSTGAMARLRIPQIQVDLPVYHDADKASMADGVGHMYGSSLPVGGPGSHAVLAAHTGYAGRTFFDRLPELQPGQLFMIDVAGQTLTYRIDAIVLVAPSQLEAVQRVPGQDLVTLVTCHTPPGQTQATQRLLVRGVRAPDQPTTVTTASTDATVVPVSYPTVIQVWMWPRLGGAAAALAILVAMVVAWVVHDLRARRMAAPRSRQARASNDFGHT